MKIIQQVLFTTLLIFLTIAGMTHYNRANTLTVIQEQYKLGYTIGCAQNALGVSIVECQMRAEDSVNSND